MTLTVNKVAFATGLNARRLPELDRFRKRWMLPGKPIGSIKKLVDLFLRVFLVAARDSTWFAVVFDWFQFLRSDELRKRPAQVLRLDRKSTRLNSSHRCISYAVFCLKKKKYKKR